MRQLDLSVFLFFLNHIIKEVINMCTLAGITCIFHLTILGCYLQGKDIQPMLFKTLKIQIYIILR